MRPGIWFKAATYEHCGITLAPRSRAFWRKGMGKTAMFLMSAMILANFFFAKVCGKLIAGLDLDAEYFKF